MTMAESPILKGKSVTRDSSSPAQTRRLISPSSFEPLGPLVCVGRVHRHDADVEVGRNLRVEDRAYIFARQRPAHTD
jgi:hypothetical protein